MQVYFLPRGLLKRIVTIMGKASGGTSDALRGRYTVHAMHLGLFRAGGGRWNLQLPMSIHRPLFWLTY